MPPAPPSDAGAGGNSGKNVDHTPPHPMAAQLAQIRPHAMFYALGALCVPLASALILLVFLLHSSLLTAALDSGLALARYLLFLLLGGLQPRDQDQTPESKQGYAMLAAYYVPLLLGCIISRALMMHTASHRLPHTSRRKRRVVLVLGVVYFLVVWLGFRGVASDAEAALLASGPEGHSAASLFLSLWRWTLILTLVSLASPFWVPTNEERLRSAEQDLLRAHAQGEMGLEKRMAANFAAQLSYLLVEPEGESQAAEQKAGAKSKAEGATESNARKDASSAPSSVPSSMSTRNNSPIVRHKSISSDVIPLVFLHGFGAGKCIWFLNLPPISSALGAQHPIYSLDLLGMGLSSAQRTMQHCRSAREAEEYFIASLEQWRASVGVERMVLAGHSFGGMIAACYALRYPSRVAHLILVSPVGLPVAPPQSASSMPSRGPAWARRWGVMPLLRWLWGRHITLSMGLHVMGPLGPFVFKRIVRGRFEHLADLRATGLSASLAAANAPLVNLDALTDYLYHVNAGACPGHKGLSLLLRPGAFAFDPLLPRLAHLQTGVSLLYGSHDWMDAGSGRAVVDSLRPRGIHAEVLIVPRAGHQLYLESPAEFNAAIVDIVRRMQKHLARQTNSAISAKQSDSSRSGSSGEKEGAQQQKLAEQQQPVEGSSAPVVAKDPTMRQRTAHAAQRA